MQEIEINRAYLEACQRNEELTKKNELEERQHQQNLENEIEREKDEVTRENIDADFLRFTAFERVVEIMKWKKFKGVSSKLDEKDVVGNFAKTWFGQEASSKLN